MHHVASAQALNTTYLWAGIIVSVVALGTGLLTLAKGVRTWAANEAKQRANIEMVPELVKRMTAIEKAIKPNGKDTQQIGDIAARVEEKIDKLDSKLDRHIGGAEKEGNAIWRAIHKLEEAA